MDGPLPTHYEPAESPVQNPLYRQQASPVLQVLEARRQPARPGRRPAVPYVITTYRLTEHYLAGRDEPLDPVAHRAAAGAVRRDRARSWPQEKGIGNLDWVRITHAARRDPGQGAGHPAACAPFTIDGKTVHHVGMPWHWGYKGLVTGDVVNDLTALVGDPNVSIHEGKAFVCNVEKA